DSPRSRRNTTSRLRATLQRWPGPNGPIVDGFGVIPGKPVVSVDGLRPPSLTTGAAATSARSISGLMDIITPVSSLTNSCPEKPGAAHGELDALIVTGAQPRATRLNEEPYWEELIELIEWAKENTASTILSCLAAHAGVLHLDGVERRPLPEKCSGVFAFQAHRDHPLAGEQGRARLVPHSRYN